MCTCVYKCIHMYVYIRTHRHTHIHTYPQQTKCSFFICIPKPSNPCYAPAFTLPPHSSMTCLPVMLRMASCQRMCHLRLFIIGSWTTTTPKPLGMKKVTLSEKWSNTGKKIVILMIMMCVNHSILLTIQQVCSQCVPLFGVNI